jgi:molybdopterin molybdotransferase
MISPEEAWTRLAADLPAPGTETIPRRRALGRILAASVRSTVDLPAHDVSAMDGYAVAAAVEAGERLPVGGTIAAGDPPGIDLEPGNAVRIMTGAPVPAGASAVVPVEHTDGGIDEVAFARASVASAHIRRRAEIVRAGEVILAAGSRLTPGALSLLASHGLAEVDVLRAPSIAFVSTGDEVVSADGDPKPGQLRDSHSDFLLAAAAGLGLSLTPLGIAGDNRNDLEPLLRRGLDFDVLLVSGGVSMGEFDIVEDVLADLGCRVLFDKVAVQPGKPLVAARHDGGLVFGLPGNPASVMVSFWLFVRPALRRILGLDDGYWTGAIEGRLAAPLPGAKSRDRFLPARVTFSAGGLLVHPLPPKGSHDVMAYARGSALVRVPAHAEPADAGSPCQILPLVDWPPDPNVEQTPPPPGTTP